MRENPTIGRKILSIAFYSWDTYNIYSTREKGKYMNEVIHDIAKALDKSGWDVIDSYGVYAKMLDEETGCHWNVHVYDDDENTYVVVIEYVYNDTGDLLFSVFSSGTYKHIKIADYTNMMRKIVTGINTINADIEHDCIVEDFEV